MATNKLDELIAALETAFGGNRRALSATAELPIADVAGARERTATDAVRRDPVDHQTVIVAPVPLAGSSTGADRVGDAQVGAALTASAASDAGLGQLTAELQLLRPATSQHTVTLQGNTETLAAWLLGSTSPIAAASSGGGAGGVLSKTLGSMFGISPLISGVLSLFGIGQHQDPPPLVDFSLPAPINQDIGVRPDNSLTPLTYGDNGLAKPDPRTVASSTQVNVQVNAMDSRSFVDRSDDIARAVKEAMLHSHSLNDVVVDL